MTQRIFHPLRVAAWISLATLFFAGAGCQSQEKKLAKVDEEAAAYHASANKAAFPGRELDKLDLGFYRDYQDPGTGELAISLRQALGLAALHNRQYQNAREALFQSAMQVYLQNYYWGWNPTNAFGAFIGRELDSDKVTALEGTGSVGVSKKLKYGGQFSAGYSLSVLRALANGSSTDWTTMVNFSLMQPLWGGASALAARESLTQAERSLIYAVRNYERQRKQLLSDISSRYYSVLRAQDNLETSKLNLTRLKENRERSAEMADVGRIPIFQLDQARQDEYSASTSVVDAEQSLLAAVDDLNLAIGLPVGLPVALDKGELERLWSPKLPLPPITLEQACDYALKHRLDLKNTEDQLADAERGLEIAAEALKGKLNLNLTYNVADSQLDSNDAVGISELDNGRLKVGASGELPWDRTAALVSYRQAQIGREQARRAVIVKREEILRAIRNDWRRLQSSQQNYQILVASLELAQRRADSTDMLFEAGKIQMRDVLSAKDALFRGKLSLTAAVVSHRLTLMTILMDLEMMDTASTTLWSADIDALTPEKIGTIFQP